MNNLTFVGLSDDGSALILSSGDGTRHRLPIDERLRSATRGGRTHMDVSDTPVTARDIQAKLRAGATPTEVAEFSGWNVDRVEAFAAPVLQERGWVAEKAQQCPVGRGEEDPTLGEVVTRRLAERGVDEDSTRWDSWRREDGLWTVLLAYPAGQGDRVATWSFDSEAGSLSAEDDEARWFIEQGVPEPERPRLLQVPNDDEPPAARPAYAGNHPAGRLQHTGPGPDRESGQLSAPRPEAPATTTPRREPETPADGPRWDEVLFGSPRDDNR